VQGIGEYRGMVGGFSNPKQVKISLPKVVVNRTGIHNTNLILITLVKLAPPECLTNVCQCKRDFFVIHKGMF